ncbi:RNA polymerase sigma factor [Pleomorphovibrio marinus]|uniref:RNA polymerase sigma factor n=1 Tax=Pleomorphovibrio marinus TaxID=2164132 RepID=UPI000E09F80E|nr:sigma-70 family RNA polymerase sigma factor [Pleomorphovibrio marinus]
MQIQPNGKQVQCTGFEEGVEEVRELIPPLNDSELWTLFKSGDEGAFISIYKNYSNLLFNFGCQFTQDRDLIKDCLQDFFIYLRTKRSNLGDTNSIKLYLLKSFRRKVIDYTKKQSKEKDRLKQPGFFEFPIQFSHETVFINRQFESQQLFKLENALQKLEIKEREAIYHFYYDNLSYEQIAELLEFSRVSSARRLIYRALSNLRKYMVLALLYLGIINENSISG